MRQCAHLESIPENVHRKNKRRNNLREHFGDLYLLAQLRNPCSFHAADSKGTCVSVHTLRAYQRTSTGKINEETISENISGTFISLPSSETRVHFMLQTVKVHASVCTP